MQIAEPKHTQGNTSLVHTIVYCINLGNTVDSKTMKQTALLFLLRNLITYTNI